ncbi:MAG: BolA/IbaG family iron-sulfur metabolism protein [Chlamydiota bacterium]
MIEVNQMIEAIESTLQGAEVRVMNPRKDGLHFDAIVISPLFRGKSLMKQHQMVLSPLKGLFDSKLHALSLKTYTPEEWNEGKR